MKFELICCMDVTEPKLEDVTGAVVRMVDFLRDHGVSNLTFLNQFELAAAEALSNAVEHGCAEADNKFFHTRLYLRQDHVELRVADPSDFSGPESAPSLPEDPYVEGGRGLFLMSQMADEVRHENENGRHVLMMRKRFPDGQWHHVPEENDQTLAEMTEELVSSYEMISTLVSLGEWLASAPDMLRFMEGALEKLCSVTGAESAYVRLKQNQSLDLCWQWGKSLQAPVENLPYDGFGIESEVFRTGQEVTLPMDFTLPARDPLGGLFVSGFVAPIWFKERRLGVLVVGRTKPSPYFNAGKLKIARTVDDYLGITATLGELQKRRAAEERSLRDLEIAAQIQGSLMPREFSVLPGLQMFGTCRPALQAGGDYFDALVLPDQSVLCVIADVMGKGLSAALLATMLRTNLHAIVDTGLTSPGEILSRVNRLMSPDLTKLGMFLTMACVCISPDRKIVKHSSAGQPSGLLQKSEPSAEIVLLEGSGLPVGIFHDSDYTSEEVEFQAGDRLMLFTDGIAEATNPAEEMFQATRLHAFMQRTRALAPRETVERLLKEIDDFTENAPPSDDRTILLVTRE